MDYFYNLFLKNCFGTILHGQFRGASCPSASVTISNVTLSNTTLNNSTSTCNYVNGSNISTFPESGGTTATLNRGVGYNLSVTAVNGDLMFLHGLTLIKMTCSRVQNGLRWVLLDLQYHPNKLAFHLPL